MCTESVLVASNTFHLFDFSLSGRSDGAVSGRKHHHSDRAARTGRQMWVWLDCQAMCLRL